MTEAATTNEIPADLITVTDLAMEKMAELIEQADEEIAGIRVFVHGGGCSGLSYGMTYAEEILPTDSVLSGNGCKVLVDPVALGYLGGCEIDYRESDMGASFVFNNVFQSVGGSGACGGCGGACGA